MSFLVWTHIVIVLDSLVGPGCFHWDLIAGLVVCRGGGAWFFTETEAPDPCFSVAFFFCIFLLFKFRSQWCL